MAPILVTGATGYIGGRLVPRLLALGREVRCLARDPERLAGKEWRDRVDVRTGDVSNPQSLDAALAGVEIAYYLIHSLGGGSDFHRRDVEAARNFGAAAARAGVSRIVYLGGLARDSAELSEHLRSRLQTGSELRAAARGVRVTEFRASVIVGSGSLSFEIVRYLTERLPVMICPRWVYTRTQPISIRNVLDYLSGALGLKEGDDEVIEIGGADVVTYDEMMRIYADVRGLKRLLIPVPVLTPRLSSYWVNLVTPIPAVIARPLIEGLKNESVVTRPTARSLFSDIEPDSYRTAVRAALSELDARLPESVWSDALSTSDRGVPPVLLRTHTGMILERRQKVVRAPTRAVYKAFSRLGGQEGWLYMDWAWQLRGIADRVLGGVGMRRGRRHPSQLSAGEALDFWRVESVEPGHKILLRAEMKVPGNAWLQFEVSDHGAGNSLLAQTAFFAPKGLFGSVYWYALYPIHSLIFSGLIDAVAAQAEGNAG